MASIDPYARERAFIATLPAWRRLLARLNWRSPLYQVVPVDAAAAAMGPSLKNATKATLLLLLGVGVFVLLAWSQLLFVVLLAVPVFGVLALVAAVVVGLWRAIYDTLQEGESVPSNTSPETTPPEITSLEITSLD